MSVQNEITRLIAAKEAISQAIAEKGVTVPNGAKLDELGALIAAIEAGGGGGTSNEDALVTGALTDYENDRVTDIRGYAFYRHGSLKTVNFPAVTQVSGASAFGECPSLTTANFPAATLVSGGNVFNGCTSLTTANFPVLNYAYYRMFYNCTALTTANFPALQTMAEGMFSGCSKLTAAYLPAVTTIADSAFYGCSALTTVDASLATAVRASAFYNCKALAVLDLRAVKKIEGSYVFRSSGLLKTLILRSTTVCTLSNKNCFDSTPFASTGTGGTVYVPAALVESYKTATNWSTLYGYGTCTFAAIEGSEYE